MTIQSTTSKPYHHSGVLTTTTQLSRTPGVQRALPEKAEQRTIVTFDKLWDNYPSGHPMKGKDAPDDQCTIKLSVAMHKAGIDMKSYKGEGHANLPDIGIVGMRVKEMIKWLDTRPFPEIAKSINVAGEDWRDKIHNKTGIIAFCNYWARNEAQKKGAPTGDHIDLWNGSRTTHNSIGAFGAYVGRGVGIHGAHIPFTGLDYSDIDKADPILFWEIK